VIWRPLSRRNRPDPRFDETQPGLPDYLLQPAIAWLQGLLWTDDPASFHQVPDVKALQTLQIALRMATPLDWSNGGYSAFQSLIEQMVGDRELALDVLDFCVQHLASEDYANELGATLAIGGSEWAVSEAGDEGPQLLRRTIGPMQEAIENIHPSSERAHHHLSTAWRKLVGRDADPSAAYREAIRAVEVVAKPVVIPNDSNATLGKIIAAIRSKPEKWEVALDKALPEQVADMADLIWKGQQDRHGTDNPEAPLNVSQEEADAAVHIAVPLVRLFASGGFRRTMAP